MRASRGTSIGCPSSLEPSVTADAQPRSVNPHSARLIVGHWRLLWRVARTDLKTRYAGSVLGIAWVFLMPALVLGTNALVYSQILRIQATGLSGMRYVLYIFAGMVPYIMTAEAIQTGVQSVLTSKAVWTNTVFPVDLAPPKAVLLSQAPFVVGFTAILIMLAAFGELRWTAALLPLLWILQVLALVGLGWILSMINLVFRDLPNVISLILMVLLVGSPIAYTPDMVPPQLRFFLAINPLAYFVRAYQRAIVLGEPPDPVQAVVLIVLSIGLFWLGGYFFARAKVVMLDYV
jgi:lipopolysaccharide transport system permease protein